MIPMRDGIHLQTAILTPLDQKAALPILLSRTPYGIPAQAPTTIPPVLKELMADGYIRVVQNLRGRFKSEGCPAPQVNPTGPDVNETTDACDATHWLVKNIPDNNGRVGIYGVSYGTALPPRSTPAPSARHPAVPESGFRASRTG